MIIQPVLLEAETDAEPWAWLHFLRRPFSLYRWSVVWSAHSMLVGGSNLSLTELLPILDIKLPYPARNISESITTQRFIKSLL